MSRSVGGCVDAPSPEKRTQFSVRKSCAIEDGKHWTGSAAASPDAQDTSGQL